jgi:hypothetical protein
MNKSGRKRKSTKALARQPPSPTRDPPTQQQGGGGAAKRKRTRKNNVNGNYQRLAQNRRI